jgi:hypothetical protein
MIIRMGNIYERVHTSSYMNYSSQSMNNIIIYYKIYIYIYIYIIHYYSLEYSTTRSMHTTTRVCIVVCKLLLE